MDLKTEFINNKVIPVYNHSDIEVLKQIVDKLVAANKNIFEFTNRSDNALKVFSELVTYTKQFENFHLGVGTIFTITDAQYYKNAGASFIVSPNFNEELSHWAKGQNILYIPGCATVTEFYKAYMLGHEFIKLFPANVYGTSFLKALKSVLPQISVMPTGGISFSKEAINQWIDAGASSVGIGDNYIKALLELPSNEIKNITL